MKDHSKNLKNLKENSDTIFNELFGSKKQEVEGNKFIEKIGTNKFRMGNSIILSVQGATETEMLSYDWENSSLDWLLECVFTGILNLDLKKGILNSFGGEWKVGVFRGLSFGNHSKASFGIKGQESKVKFGDGVVKPRYVAKYDTWKVSPMAFVSGTIDRESGGILGMPDAHNAPVTTPFNILTLTPGKQLAISVASKLPVRGDNGKMQKAQPTATHTIKMLKRIDSKSSDVSLEITNGETSKSITQSFPWSEFLKNGIKSLMYVPGETMGLLKLAGIDLSEKNTTAEVNETGKSTLTQSSAQNVAIEKQLAKTQQTFDLKKVPYLNIDKPAPGASGKMEPGMKNTEVFFYLPKADYLNKFNEVKRNIESGQMAADIDLIVSGIRNNVINGYYDNLFLKNMFNNIQGGKATPAEYAVPMKKLNDFMQFFVDRIYVQGDNGSVDKATQDAVKSKIKKALAIDSYIKPEAQVPGAEVPAKTVAPPKKKGSQVQMTESVRDAVRNIISENLKHF